MEAVYLSWIQQRIIPWVYVQVYPSNMQAIKGNAFLYCLTGTWNYWFRISIQMSIQHIIYLVRRSFLDVSKYINIENLLFLKVLWFLQSIAYFPGRDGTMDWKLLFHPKFHNYVISFYGLKILCTSIIFRLIRFQQVMSNFFN